MTRIGFVLKPEQPQTRLLLEELVPWLHSRGHEVLATAEDQIALLGVRTLPADELGEHIDLAVALGGDGTMLRANLLVGDHGVPILGINLGRLGFLAPIDPEGAREALGRAIAGTLLQVPRMRFRVTYYPAQGEPVARSALNDVVINQGAMARLIDLEAYLDTDLISAYRVDGLVIATPTGSTAYNLAAGGPIVVATHECMVLTPICAHGLTHRPLVLPPDKTLRIQFSRPSFGVVLTIDGQWAHTFQPGDRVEIVADETPLSVFAGDAGYFDILREKLHWGARGDR